MRADARRNFDALVAAGRQMFTERGSDAAIEDIAKLAGVGVGTLYRHFPQRIDLVEAVYGSDIDDLAVLADTVAGDPDAWNALEDWLRAFVRYVELKRTFLTELQQAFEKNPGLRSRAREQLALAAGKVLARAQQAGLARGDLDATDLMQLVGGMCLSPTALPGQNVRLLSVVLAGIRQPR